MVGEMVGGVPILKGMVLLRVECVGDVLSGVLVLRDTILFRVECLDAVPSQPVLEVTIVVAPDRAVQYGAVTVTSMICEMVLVTVCVDVLVVMIVDVLRSPASDGAREGLRLVMVEVAVHDAGGQPLGWEVG